MTLNHGDTGEQVENLQQRLKRAGYKIGVDGIYGDATEAAVRDFQLKHDLVTDGIAGRVTLETLLGRPPANTVLKQSDLVSAAQVLEIDLPAIQAVTQIEAKNTGFIAPNRPDILFERHIMRRQMLEAGQDTTWAEKERPNLVNAKPGGYKGGIKEHIRLIRAQGVYAPAAPESASWGLFQIMGFHWRTLGYESQYEFARLMSESEQDQLGAFVRFIQANPAIHSALAEHRWADFAAGYNGPNYEINNYDVRLERAWKRHKVAWIEATPQKTTTRRRRSHSKRTTKQVKA